jgi:hypothetical protein
MTDQPPGRPAADDELRELLAAHALHALEPGDRARVEAYVASTPTARDELDVLRETATMLALLPSTTEQAPPELWARITEDIAAREPTAPVVALRPRRGVPWRVAAPLAAAAVLVVALLAFQVFDLRNQVDDANVARADRARFENAAGAPGSREAALAAGGTTMARVTVLPDGTGYIANEALAPLADDRTYQLWALVGSAADPTVISAGVLGAEPDVAPFRVAGPVVGFAITDEAAPGVVTSEQDPVALGLLPT